MFKRVGTPVLIEEVLSFDPAKAEAVKCSACGHELGSRCGSVLQQAGIGAKVAAKSLSVQCTDCGEMNHV